MLLLTLALASSQLPAFNPGLAAAQCVEENDAQDFDAQAECYKSLIRDYREVTALHRFAKPVLDAAIERCVVEYADGRRPDWNMIQICANRDDRLLTEVSVASPGFDAARARTHCRKEQNERPDVVLADCFKYEVIGSRNFAMFQAQYKEEAVQSSFRICLERWTADGITDWDMASFCAQDQLDGFERLAPLAKGAASR